MNLLVRLKIAAIFPWLILMSSLSACSSTPTAIAPGRLIAIHYGDQLNPDHLDRGILPAINTTLSIGRNQFQLLCYPLQHANTGARLLYRNNQLNALSLGNCDDSIVPAAQCPALKNDCLERHLTKLAETSLNTREWRNKLLKMEKRREEKLNQGAALGSALFPLMIMTSPVLMLFNAHDQ